MKSRWILILICLLSTHCQNSKRIEPDESSLPEDEESTSSLTQELKTQEITPDVFNQTNGTNITVEAGKSFAEYKQKSQTLFFRALAGSLVEHDTLLEQARVAAKQALLLKPNDPDTLAHLAHIYIQVARYRGAHKKIRLDFEARKYAFAALQQNSNQATANAVIGITDYDIATLNDYDKSILLQSLNRGLPDLTLTDAATSLQKAVTAQPNEIFFRLSLAKVFLADKKILEAKEQLQIIGKQKPLHRVDEFYKIEADRLLKESNAEPEKSTAEVN